MNNSLEITKTNSDCAQYTGTVTVATYYGDRLIKREVQHNAGLPMLFSFLSSCLQGNWHEARDKRPCKIVLLKQGEAEILIAEELENAGDTQKVKGLSSPTNAKAIDNKGDHYWSSKYAVCSPMMYDAAAFSTTTNENSSTTYHFRVPFLSLVSGSKIKKLMLLPPMASAYQEDACAYFVLKDEIKVPEAGANYTVIIDWKLTFENGTIKGEN